MQGHLEKFSVFSDNLDGIKNKQKQLATERAENVLRIADYKSRLVVLKSNEEYTAMLKQISHTEKSKAAEWKNVHTSSLQISNSAVVA